MPDCTCYSTFYLALPFTLCSPPSLNAVLTACLPSTQQSLHHVLRLLHSYQVPNSFCTFETELGDCTNHLSAAVYKSQGWKQQ